MSISEIQVRQRAYVGGAVAAFAYMINAGVLVDSYDRYVTGDERAVMVISLLVFAAAITVTATIRAHAKWHPGRIGVSWGVALLVTLLVTPHLLGLPLVIAAAAYTWYWLPDSASVPKATTHQEPE